MTSLRTNVRGEKPKRKTYSEKLVHRSFKAACQCKGTVAFKNHPMTEEGIPDLIVHRAGMGSFYVETKTTGEECTPIQKEFHKRLLACGIHTYVLDVKVTNFYDLFVYCYTTYESKYFERNPFKEKDLQRIEDERNGVTSLQTKRRKML